LYRKEKWSLRRYLETKSASSSLLTYHKSDLIDLSPITSDSLISSSILVMPEQTPTTGSNSSNNSPSLSRGFLSKCSAFGKSLLPLSAARDPAQQSETDPPSSNAVTDTPSTNKPRSSCVSDWLLGWRGHHETATYNSNDNPDSRVRNNDKRAYYSETGENGNEVPGTEVRAAYPDAITSVPSKTSRAHPQEKGKVRDPNNQYCFNDD
jgi:hypothetical protein